MEIIFDDRFTLSVVDFKDEQLADWAYKFREEHGNGVCRFVRGRKCNTAPELFDEFAAALQFPYYFGENWNAFEDCISNLDWLDCDLCVVVILDANRLLPDSPDEFKLLMDMLQRARTRRTLSLQSVEWAKKDLPFFVLLQVKDGAESELKQRLDAIGIHYS